MRKLLLLLLPIFLIAVVFLAATDVDSARRVPNREDLESQSNLTNLIYNPHFDNPYESYIPPNGHPDCPHGICTTAVMADGWTPWWAKTRTTDVNPEYKPAEMWHTDPDRVLSPIRAQQFFSFWRTHEAGFYQKVTVSPGVNYCFGIWTHSWSADDDDDAYSGPFYGNLYQKIGIDPAGGTDPFSASIQWSALETHYDIYEYVEKCAIAQEEVLTVYTYSRPEHPVKHNDVYWDDATLYVSAELTVDPAEGFGYLAETGSPRVMTQTLQVEISENQPISWTATTAVTSSLAVEITPPSGVATSTILISVNSAGYSSGSYTADIIIETTPAIGGSPAVVPVILIVRDELEKNYVPAVSQN